MQWKMCPLNLSRLTVIKGWNQFNVLPSLLKVASYSTYCWNYIIIISLKNYIGLNYLMIFLDFVWIIVMTYLHICINILMSHWKNLNLKLKNVMSDNPFKASIELFSFYNLFFFSFIWFDLNSFQLHSSIFLSTIFLIMIAANKLPN